MNDNLKCGSVWHVECLDKNGQLKWTEIVENLVTNEGLNFILDTVLRGSAYTASFFVGLKGTGAAASGNTLASHVAWAELTDYVGNRKATTFSVAAAGSSNNSSGRPEFDMTDDITVHGMFLATVASGTSGILVSVVDFVSPRAITTGDILRVNITYNIASA